MKKVKVIWSADTAEKVAAAKTTKYGKLFTTVPVAGGGFAVVALEGWGVGDAIIGVRVGRGV